MGYRNYIGSISKREYNKIKKLTVPEIFHYKGKVYDEEDWIGPYEIVEKEHFELGKYVDEFPGKLFKPFFKNKETNGKYSSDGEFYVVEKEFLLAVIERYRDGIRSDYKRLLDPFFESKGKIKAAFLSKKENPITDEELTAIYLLVDKVRMFGLEWGVTGWFPDQVPYNAQEGSEETVSSWKYEYAIFQLVQLYNNFDWKRRVMVYYGY
jgi:hypothetical protein